VSRGRAKNILAVSSGGGHWVELMRLRPAFEGHRMGYVTVSEMYRADVADEQFYVVNDATRWNYLRLLKLILRLAMILLRERPDVVISTGAAPGYLAIRLAKLLTRARTIWLDSIAEAGDLSLSGIKVRRYADLWLTQWPELAQPDGPNYKGNVL